MTSPRPACPSRETIERMADEAERGYEPEGLVEVSPCAGCRAIQHKIERAGSDRMERIMRQEMNNHLMAHHGVRPKELRG